MSCRWNSYLFWLDKAVKIWRRPHIKKARANFPPMMEILWT
jgi:hypothetical protein